MFFKRTQPKKTLVVIYGKNTNHSSQKGQELIEFAVVLPLLLLIVFGVFDLGRLFHASIVISNAAREGARYGTFYPDAPADIIAAVMNEASSSGVDISSSTVTVSCPLGCERGTPIRVTVNYNFVLILQGIVPFGNIPLVRSAEMMVP